MTSPRLYEASGYCTTDDSSVEDNVSRWYRPATQDGKTSNDSENTTSSFWPQYSRMMSCIMKTAQGTKRKAL